MERFPDPKDCVDRTGQTEQEIASLGEGTPYKKRDGNPSRFFAMQIQLFIFTLACSFRLFLALDAGLFIVLSLADLLDNSVSGSLSLETLECALERFVLFNFDLTH